MVYSPPTRPAGVRGPLIFLQGGHPFDFDGNLKGKIGLLTGSLSLQEPTLKRCIVESGLRGLIVVDNRLVHGLTYPAGAAPQWVGEYTVPTVTLPLTAALELVRNLPLHAKINVDSQFLMAESQNVVGEIPGSRWPNDVIVVTAHHDCVHDVVGADDNGSGVVTLLEIARILGQMNIKRTIRLISYGVEERLSVGSYLHWRLMSARKRRQARLVVNIDAIASAVGEDRVLITGTDQLLKYVARHYRRLRYPAIVESGAHIYSDQFAPNLFGVPSIRLGRTNLAGGGYYHLHSALDDLENVSYDVVSRSITTLTALLIKLANAPKVPFPRRISTRLAGQIRALGAKAYRHPWPLKTFAGLPTFMPPDDRFEKR